MHQALQSNMLIFIIKIAYVQETYVMLPEHMSTAIKF